ncbi:MAG: hypothetical protein Q7U30_01680, partial [Methylicorpusculum sp.]|nr:hypothetical protein [Methylicorpusculum sp.]
NSLQSYGGLPDGESALPGFGPNAYSMRRRFQLSLMNTKEIHGRSIILMSVRLVMDDAKIKI